MFPHESGPKDRVWYCVITMDTASIETNKRRFRVVSLTVCHTNSSGRFAPVPATPEDAYVTARHLFPTGTPEMATQAPVSRSSGSPSSTSICGFNAGPGFSSSNSAYMQRSAHWLLFFPGAFGVVGFGGSWTGVIVGRGLSLRFAFFFFLTLSDDGCGAVCATSSIW